MPDIRPPANSSALVLNATYEPLGVVSVRRATILVLSAKAVCVADGDGILHSERHQPAGAARWCGSPGSSGCRTAPYVGLSRRAIFARDGWRCAYCRGTAETIDHVLPRSRGGGHAWENVVAACARCNHTKGDKTPAELGWRLHVARRRAEGRGVARPRPPGPGSALGRVARLPHRVVTRSHASPRQGRRTRRAKTITLSA